MRSGLPRAATGVAVHYGRAVAVSLAAGLDGPLVIDRRSLEIAAPGLPFAPYHHEALELNLAEAEALISNVRKGVSEQAGAALRALRDDLRSSFDLAALALREARPMPGSLAEILGSRAVYIADSELYRDAVHEAASELGLRVFLHPKDEAFAFAARATNADVTDVASRIRGWRKALGPPWQKDHHAAAAAAMGALIRLSIA